jgi:hypothetical protein
VIATGFNEETIEQQKAEHAPKMMIKGAAFKSGKDVQVKQMTIFSTEKEGNTAEKRPAAPIPQHITREEVIDNVLNAGTQVFREDNEPAYNEQLISSGSDIGVPSFIKKNQVLQERSYVSKGNIITQYEDDMDVPTFLRKQMQ